MTIERTCRDCGMTKIPVGVVDMNGDPIAWHDDDQCTTCADLEAEALRLDARRYRFLRARQARTADLDAGIVVAGQPGLGTVLTGEELDRALDREMTGTVATGETLERRLARCLADVVDEPLLVGSDEVGNGTSPLHIRLVFFKPDLANHACELLEEAGL